MATDVWKQCRGDGPENDVPKPMCCTPRSREIPVEGIQIGRQNRIAAISWVRSRGGRAEIARDGVAIIGRVVRFAYDTDWVVRHTSTEFFVIPNRVFHTLYDVQQQPIRRSREQ